MTTLDPKLAEQIVKVALNSNGQRLEFDKQFLKIVDTHTEIRVEEKEDRFILTSRYKD